MNPRRDGLRVTEDVLSLSFSPFSIFFSPRCTFNLLRMRAGPPLCLYSLLIFSLLLFSTSLPIFMPVPLCQYAFRQTFALLFHPFFSSIQGFPPLSSSRSSFLTKHRILTFVSLIFFFRLSVCLRNGIQQHNDTCAKFPLLKVETVLRKKKQKHLIHKNVKMVSSDAKNLYISYLLLDSLLTTASEHFTGAVLKLRLIIMCKIFNLSTGCMSAT